MDDLISRQAAIEALKRAEALTRAFGYHNVIDTIIELPSAQPEVNPIGYQDCANAMLKMWIDKVVTDGEYNRIMDKLNKHWRRTDE